MDTPVQPHFWKVIKKVFGSDTPVTLADAQEGWECVNENMQ